MPVYAWSMLVVGLMIVFAFPAVIAGTALLEMERAFDWPFFDASRGGDPILWQHLFWFFGHPEVYIIFLPAAGLVSSMLPALVGAPLAGHRAIVVALVATGFFSFALWAHHMFTAGLGSLSLSFVSAASLAVAVPAGMQVFAWMATLQRGRARLAAPTLFILGFLFTFVAGGLTGVMVAVLPFDWQVHDSYFIVAHLHYVLVGGMVFPVFAALYFWLPLHNGHRLSERLGRWVFGLVFVGFHLTFFPMHVAGLRGMPRRVYTYDAGLGWELPNLLSSIGAAVLGAGVLLLTWDVVRTLRRPQQEHGDPWRAPTLEWAPAGDYALRSMPQVEARDPMWNQPGLVGEIVAGRHWLPGTATGLRETIVTGARRADLRHLIVLPGPGWMPFVAAVGTSAFFLLLTVKWLVAAFAFGLLAVACTLVWMWDTDRSPAASARVGEGVELPVGAKLAGSHSWWATVILLAVDATVQASIAFSHIHLSMRLDVCPPPGAALPPVAASALAVAGYAASAALYALCGRGIGRDALSRWRLAPLVLAALALAGAFGWNLLSLLDAGLAPQASGWAASLAGLLSYQGFHVAAMAVTGGFLAARIGCGLARPRQRATYDNVGLLWWGTCAQGALVALLPHAVAWAMR